MRGHALHCFCRVERLRLRDRAFGLDSACVALVIKGIPPRKFLWFRNIFEAKCIDVEFPSDTFATGADLGACRSVHVDRSEPNVSSNRGAMRQQRRSVVTEEQRSIRRNRRVRAVGGHTPTGS
jgi:hypothetical protein